MHLYYAEGYSAEEISQLMHIPAATVRTRLHRARKQLKELLEVLTMKRAYHDLMEQISVPSGLNDGCCK